MKKLNLVFLALTMTSASALATSADSGRLATDVEYVYRYAGDSRNGDCRTFEGPQRVEAFKQKGNEAKVAEFTGLSKLRLCKRGRSYTFSSVRDLEARNERGYRVSDVMFKLEVKDIDERRVGRRSNLSPKVSTKCGTKRQSKRPLSGSITQKQYQSADTLAITIGSGKWHNCN